MAGARTWITQYLGALLYEKPTSYIKVVLAAAAGGFLLSAPLRYLYRRLWGQRFAIVAPAVLLAAWVVALGWRVVINSSYLRWVETEPMAGEPWYGIFVGTLSSSYLLLCWTGLYFGMNTTSRCRSSANRCCAPSAGAGGPAQDVAVPA